MYWVVEKIFFPKVVKSQKYIYIYIIPWIAEKPNTTFMSKAKIKLFDCRCLRKMLSKDTKKKKNKK